MKRFQSKFALAIVAALLTPAGLPGKSWADRSVMGIGSLHKVNVASNTLTIGKHELSVTRSSRFFESGGIPIRLEELAARRGEEASFVATPMGSRLYLGKLTLGVEDED